MILLKPEDYYTQRNNKLYPSSSCMNTSRVMFYIAAGIPYKNDSKFSDDDYFYSLLNSPEAIEYANKKYPNLKHLPKNEIHGMYAWLDEKVTGKRRTDFKLDLLWDHFVYELSCGRPVMTSGRFPGLNGHAFVFVGYDKNKEELIAADPWGNPHFNYRGSRGKKGYGIRYDRKFFEDHVKPGEKKWAHILL